jgi:hypothetical protein
MSTLGCKGPQGKTYVNQGNKLCFRTKAFELGPPRARAETNGRFCSLH